MTETWGGGYAWTERLAREMNEGAMTDKSDSDHSESSEYVIREDALVALVAAIRAADETFQSGVTGGGGTRHYVRDCLLPEFQLRGIVLLLNPLETDEEEAK